eukprot:1146634-Pelagomonas_calceolata.AAC.2
MAMPSWHSHSECVAAVKAAGPEYGRHSDCVAAVKAAGPECGRCGQCGGLWTEVWALGKVMAMPSWHSQ